MSTACFHVVRVVGRSLQATAFTASLYESGILLRERYLWPVDGCTMENYAESDQNSIHFFATWKEKENHNGNTAIGTVQYDPTTNRLRQLIVEPSFRKLHAGTRLVDAVKEEVTHRYQQEYLKVHAWLDSAPFYARNGFKTRGDVYDSNGVMCQVMVYDPNKI
jgi:predicted GNAT family N-acyltransferase